MITIIFSFYLVPASLGSISDGTLTITLIGILREQAVVIQSV